MTKADRASQLRATLQNTDYHAALSGLELCKFCPSWAVALIQYANGKKWISVCREHVDAGHAWLACVRGLVG